MTERGSTQGCISLHGTSWQKAIAPTKCRDVFISYGNGTLVSMLSVSAPHHMQVNNQNHLYKSRAWASRVVFLQSPHQEHNTQWENNHINKHHNKHVSRDIELLPRLVLALRML